MCGAGVGALVMFVLMSRTGTTPASKDHAVRIRPETPESMSDEAIVDSPSEQLNPDRPEKGLSPVKPFTRVVDRSVLTMESDPLRQWESTYLSDGPTLQVGMYLGRHGERPAQRMYKQQRENFGSQPGSPPAIESESPVSRRELMQEFLGESAAAVL
ncbi:MAG: hypothetical protein HYV60_05160 [Planctomycetia bacterium]|nr:hypothetical protein [Planctomycetia bacterium]